VSGVDFDTMKGINEIVACNANPTPTPVRTREDILLGALKTAQASLKDVLAHGDKPRQRANIERVDLPIVESAIALIEGGE